MLRRIAAIDEQRARLGEIRAALCGLLGDVSATGALANGHTRKERGEMTDTLTAATEADTEADAGCGCCRPPDPPGLEEEVRELQARKEAVERRLAGLQGVQR